MSKLDELIAELCPDGVESKPLSEIATITRGGNLQKKDFTESGVPCIHYGQIYTKYGLFTDRTYTFVSESTASKQKKAVPGDIVMAVTSENIEDVCKCVVWLGDEDIAVSGHTAIIHHNQDPKYLAYYFHSSMFFAQKQKLAHGTKVIEVTPDKLNGVRVPVPPLEVQREIVRVLDNFTFLSAELSAELSARRKQYEYYSQQLLEGYKKESRRVPISALGKWQGGKTPSMQEKRFWENGTIPWISSKDMKSPVLRDTEDHITEAALLDASMNLLPEESVAIVTRSGILKHTFPVAFVPFRTTVNQDIKALSVAEGVSARYVSFALQAYGEDIRTKTKKQGGTVDSLDFQKVLDYQIPLPDYDVQLRIVKVLENFEAICNDLKIGLPAEIEARQKQYEYYRDLLLTFAETGTTIARQTDRQTDRQAEITLLQYVFGYVYLPLGETCLMKAGKAIQAVELSESKDEHHTYECYGGNGIRGYIGKANYHGGFPIIGRQGALCGNVQYADGDFYATEHAVVVSSKGLYDQRYLYYLLIAMNLNQYKSAGAQPGLAVGKLETIDAPVPSMELQLKAVNILDRFDKLCNDLSSGLPAEIEARQKQYEYYRDKLLTFKEKA